MTALFRIGAEMGMSVSTYSQKQATHFLFAVGLGFKLHTYSKLNAK
jgi:hypothetical protein